MAKLGAAIAQQHALHHGASTRSVLWARDVANADWICLLCASNKDKFWEWRFAATQWDRIRKLCSPSLQHQQDREHQCSRQHPPPIATPILADKPRAGPPHNHQHHPHHRQEAPSHNPEGTASSDSKHSTSNLPNRSDASFARQENASASMGTESHKAPLAHDLCRGGLEKRGRDFSPRNAERHTCD